MGEIKSMWVPHYSTVHHETANVFLNNCDGIFAEYLKKQQTYTKYELLKRLKIYFFVNHC